MADADNCIPGFNAINNTSTSNSHYTSGWSSILHLTNAGDGYNQQLLFPWSKSKKMAYRVKENNTWNDWSELVTNSDLKRHHYNYENTGKDKEYAIQDVFYKLPADSDIHFVTVSCGNLFSLIVHKYIDHSYGSILRFGYGDRLTQYRIGADKWYKADLNHTESQIEKLV